MKLMRFLIGLVIGAGVAVLVTPKSGREMRRTLVGGATARLLPAAPVEFPQPEGEREWADGSGVAVAEAPPQAAADDAWAPEPVAEAGNVVVVEEPAEEPVAAAVVEARPLADDLKARIDETRAAVESEIAQPFASAGDAAEREAAVDFTEPAEVAVVEAVVADVIAEEAVAEALVTEAVAEEAARDAVAAEIVAEEAYVEAVVAEAVAEEAIAETVVDEAAAEVVVAEEIIAEAVADEAIAEEAAVGEAVAEQSATDEVAAEHTAVEEPVAEHTAVEEPVAEPSAVQPPVFQEPAPPARRAWEAHPDDAVVESAPAVEELPVVEEPRAVEERPVTEPVPSASEEPALEEAPVAPVGSGIEEAPPTGEPAPEERAGLVADIATPAAAAEPVPDPVVAPTQAAEPVTAEPAEEPETRPGGSIDQAEMRRRIEETRARLKAKAFDAMMSGEAALLSRDSGETTVPSGEDVKLDAETDSTIDESLSQEDY